MDVRRLFDQSWTLDAAENFRTFNDDGTVQTRTANAANEISGITGGWVTPGYDRAGNMISGPKPGSGATRVHYVYDAWNRLTAVKADASGSPGNTLATYRYDGANRRIEKLVTSGAHAHYYYNQDWQMLEERFVGGGGATTASNQYVWSPRYIDAPVVRLHDGNGDGDLLDAVDNIRYYTCDANHNVTATIDAATGNVVAYYAYNAYGKATAYDSNWANPGAPSEDGPLYCGYFFDVESGLYQVRNRYYDSGLSVFVSRDPSEYEAGDANLDRYVGNNPLTYTDPSGLERPGFLPGHAPGYDENGRPVRPIPRPTPGPSRPADPTGLEGHGSGGFFDSLGNSCYSMALTWKGIFQQCMGNQACIATYQEAYERGPLGQTKDSCGCYYYGTRGALGVATTATACAVVVGGVEVTCVGNQSLMECNILSKGNVIKVISRPAKCGWRIDPAHHGKPWGHSHWWWW